MMTIGKFSIPWKIKPREVESEFRLHPTVLERLSASHVPHPTETKLYRPSQLANHPQARDFYDQDGA